MGAAALSRDGRYGRCAMMHRVAIQTHDSPAARHLEALAGNLRQHEQTRSGWTSSEGAQRAKADVCAEDAD
jgi:hypothetical protein